MECLGPQCAEQILRWLAERAAHGGAPDREAGRLAQLSLYRAAPYQEDAPAIRTLPELEGAIEHLEYAIFRRFGNQLTRAERARLDNTIGNALFKAERFCGTLESDARAAWQDRIASLRARTQEGRARVERQRELARRADVRLAQLASLTGESFEDFVAELLEALGYAVERTGGAGDNGADLCATRGGQRAIVQCKYHSQGVIGSPELQKFLGTIHHMQCHKGLYVTTRTFTLSAERFASEHPIELIDGPRLVELVEQALGPGRKTREAAFWFQG
jgi:restriction system protein